LTGYAEAQNGRVEIPIRHQYFIIGANTFRITGKELSMNARWRLAFALLIGLTVGCAKTPKETGGEAVAAKEEVESGETKVKLDQTPPAVRATIKRELEGAELEDIAKKQRDGKTIYETDIIKAGNKWEVIVAEDGSIISKEQEGSAVEQAADKAEAAGAKDSDWKENFDVDKSKLSPTGNNPLHPDAARPRAQAAKRRRRHSDRYCAPGDQGGGRGNLRRP
jgi:hypothetical protein